jgi:hypothetical protein
MSFKCQLCCKCSPDGFPSKKITVLYRQHNHPTRSRAVRKKVTKNGKIKNEWSSDKGGTGLQIAKEIMVCVECSIAWEKKQKQYPNIPVQKLQQEFIYSKSCETYSNYKSKYKPNNFKYNINKPPRTNNSNKR